MQQILIKLGKLLQREKLNLDFGLFGEGADFAPITSECFCLGIVPEGDFEEKT